MTCPYCGSEKYIYKVIIDNECMVDEVEVYRHVFCRECKQDFVEHSTYVATSFKTIKMEDWESE